MKLTPPSCTALSAPCGPLWATWNSVRLGVSRPSRGGGSCWGCQGAAFSILLLLHLWLGVAPRLRTVSAADGVTNDPETD